MKKTRQKSGDSGVKSMDQSARSLAAQKTGEGCSPYDLSDLSDLNDLNDLNDQADGQAFASEAIAKIVAASDFICEPAAGAAGPDGAVLEAAEVAGSAANGGGGVDIDIASNMREAAGHRSLDFGIWREGGETEGMPYWRGIVNFRLSATDVQSGLEIGYISFSFLPREIDAELYPSIWHFMARARGWLDVDPDADLAGLWAGVKRHVEDLGRRTEPPREASDSAGMEADLVRWAARFENLAKSFHRYHRDRPVVGFVFVEREFRRGGVACLLYIQAARWLAENYGLPLYASRFQSRESRKIWQTLREAGLSVTGTTGTTGTGGMSLDLRSAATPDPVATPDA